MKALSLWQIWASLVDIGAKQYETRSWSTDHRGLLVIHAAKSITGLLDIEASIFSVYQMGQSLDRFPLLKYAQPLLWPKQKYSRNLPLGAALCVVDLVDVLRVEDVRDSLSDQERAFGNYADGRYAWKLANPRSLATPIPMRSAQRLFDCFVPLIEFIGEAHHEPGR